MPLKFIGMDTIGPLLHKVGDTASATFAFHGHPPPYQVLLYKDGVSLATEPDVRASYRIEEGKVIFTLRKCRRSDTGKYRIACANETGEDDVDFHITIFGNYIALLEKRDRPLPGRYDMY